MGAIDPEILKLGGAFVGALIAIALKPPLPWTWFPVRRLSVAMFTGWAASPLLRWWFNIPNEPETIIAASCVVSTLSWWVWNAVLAAIEDGKMPFFSRRKD